MSDRSTRLYVPGLRVDVTAREGVPRVVPLARLARAIAAAARAAGAPSPAAVGLLLTDDGELADLNREHLGRRGPTDVLSFPLLPPEAFERSGAARSRAARSAAQRSVPGGGRAASFALPPGARPALGDIAISVERAIAQAREGRGGHDARTTSDPRDEMLLLVTHATLHLCGWDHADPAERAAMRAIEQQLLRGSR